MATPTKLPSGSWTIRIMINGQRHSFTGPTRRSCKEFEREAHVDAARGSFVAPSRSRTRVADRLEEWMAHKEADPNFSDDSLRVYASDVKLHILPHLGRLKVEDLTIETVERWRNRLTEQQGSATALRSFKVLRSFLTDQVRHGYATNNVAMLVKPPKHKSREMTFLEPWELARVVDAMDREWARDVVLGLAYIGCRVGDLSRLTEASWDRRNNRLLVVDQKTGNDRQLPVFPVLEEVLARSVARGGEFLFMTDGLHGQAIIRSNAFAKRHFKPALRAAGIGRNVRIHDLRHTCASWLIRQGFGPVQVAAYLGHSKATTTMNTYAHLFADDMQNMGEALDAMSRRSAPGNVTPIRKAE